MNGSWGVWHYVRAFRHTQGWRLHRDAFGISMEQPSHGSQTPDVETFEREPGKAEKASSATSDARHSSWRSPDLGGARRRWLVQRIGVVLGLGMLQRGVEVIRVV